MNVVMESHLSHAVFRMLSHLGSGRREPRGWGMKLFERCVWKMGIHSPSSHQSTCGSVQKSAEEMIISHTWSGKRGKVFLPLNSNQLI